MDVRRRRGVSQSIDLFIIVAAVLGVAVVIIASMNGLYTSGSTVTQARLTTTGISASAGLYLQLTNIGNTQLPLTTVGLSIGGTTLSNPQFRIGFASIPVSLAGYWTLDDGTGTSALDSSSNPGTLTLTGPANLAWVSGEFGSGIQVASTLSNACVNSGTDLGVASIASDTALQTAIQNPFTFTVWINTGANSPVTILHYQTANSAGGHDGLWIRKSGNSIVSGIVNTVPADNSMTASYTFSLNTWYFLAYVFAGTSQSLYINGGQVGSGAVSGTIGAATGFHMGTYTSSCEDSFQGGTIDEPRVYQGALTSNQIQGMYTLGPGASATITAPPSTLSSLGYAAGSSFTVYATSAAGSQTVRVTLMP